MLILCNPLILVILPSRCLLITVTVSTSCIATIPLRNTTLILLDYNIIIVIMYNIYLILKTRSRVLYKSCSVYI